MNYKYKQTREPEFNKIKAMLNADISATQIQMVTGRSSFTISRIKKSKNFEEFEKMKKVRNASTNGHTTGFLVEHTNEPDDLKSILKRIEYKLDKLLNTNEVIW